MSFYGDMAATATRLLQRFGGAITLVRTTGGSINPVTGAVVAGTSANQSTIGILKKYPDSLIDGTLIQFGDRMLVLVPGIEPLLTDKVLIGGEEWQILRIETVKPTDTPIAYFAHIRK